MTNFNAWLRISILAGCCTLAACGSGAGSDGSESAASNAAPVISGNPPAQAKVGETYLFEPQVYDPDGDTLTFSISNRPDWATFSPMTGKVAGTPPATAKPTYPDIEISVTDGKDSVSLPAFDLTVDTGTQAPVNTAPTISGSPPTNVVAGNAYEFIPTASDVDGQTLVFSIANKPSWAEFDSVIGRLSGTPSASEVGAFRNIVISVSDGVETVALPAFVIDVTSGAAPSPGNRSPVIAGSPAAAVSVGQAYAFRPTATDPDGQSLTFSITNLPAWASFNSATGALNGTPAVTHVGQTANIVISVTDGQATASLPSFSITVLPTNNPPVIGGAPSTSVLAGQPYSFTPTASDPDGHTLTFSIANKPAWASFSNSTGRLSGTPGTADVGTTSNVSISVSDGAARTTLTPFSIQVTANRAPVINGTPSASVTVGQAYSFQPSASDPDGDALTYTVVNKPTWATFSNSTGRLSGTPGSSFAGIAFNGITISVSDGSLSASLPAFSIAVESDGNQAPVISGTPPATVTAGQSYSFRPTASDPEGQTLTFTIANKPAWASFNNSTGLLSGSPSGSHVGSYAGIVITVSDGTKSASLPSFSITVASVQTGTATLRWTPPTQNEDGSPITNLKGYRIYYGTNSSNLSSVVDIASAAIDSAVVEDLSPATWYFALKAYNTSNVESAFSNIASKTIP